MLETLTNCKYYKFITRHIIKNNQIHIINPILISLIISSVSFAVISPTTILAQILSDIEKLQIKRERMEIENLKREKLKSISGDVEGQPLESRIDPDLYRIGPGDILTISVWGTVNESFETIVTPEGWVLIPSVRPQYVAELTLTKTKAVIKKAAATVYKETDVTTMLTALRSFKISVSGAVNNSGTHVVTANDRVSDAIFKAGGFEEIEEDEEIRDKKLIAKRNVILTRKNGDRVICDIQRYLITGDKSMNPLMLDGDIIHVPTIGDDIGVISLFGAFNKPDVFDYSPGDSLLELIELAGGFSTDADRTIVELVRFNADGKTTRSIMLDVSMNSKINESNFKLNSDDIIFARFKHNFREKALVEVTGEVFFPGHYLIINNRTTLKEIIELAGGVTPEASLTEATLLRSEDEAITDSEYERLKKMTREEMNEIEYEYFKAKSRLQLGRVSVDFERLISQNDPDENVTLIGKDLIFIPRQQETVNIIGAVSRPGLLMYKQDETVEYYLNKAGSYLWNANKGDVRIIRAASSEQIKAKNSDIIYIGDTIFVPEKKEIEVGQAMLNTVQFLSQLATLIFIVTNIGN